MKVVSLYLRLAYSRYGTPQKDVLGDWLCFISNIPCPSPASAARFHSLTLLNTSAYVLTPLSNISLR